MTEDKNMTVDEIISSIEAGRAEEKKDWSMSDINSLLGDDAEDPGVELEDSYDEEPDFDDEYDTGASPFEQDEQLSISGDDEDDHGITLDSGIELGNSDRPAEENWADETESAADNSAGRSDVDFSESFDAFEAAAAKAKTSFFKPKAAEPAPAAEEVPAAEEAPISEEAPTVPEADEPTRTFEPVTPHSYEPDDPTEDELSPETALDYAPGELNEELPAEAGPKPTMKERFSKFRSRLVQIVEGGEEEGEFSEEDLMDDEDAGRAHHGASRHKSGHKSGHKNEHRIEDYLKGLDENPDSPKMIMELADETGNKDAAEKKALAQKTVGIHPIHNDAIDHQILKTKVEKSPLEKSTEAGQLHFEGIEEMAAGITTNTEPDSAAAAAEALQKTRKFTNTADLEPLPTIIAADAELSTFDKTIVAKGGNKTIEHETSEPVDGQIRLTGFDDEEPAPEQVDEEHIEEQLREKRVEKVKGFKLDESAIQGAAEDTATLEFELEQQDIEQQKAAEAAAAAQDSATLRELHEGNPRIGYNEYTGDFINDEYHTEDDADRVRGDLTAAARRSLTVLIIQAVMTVAGLVMTILISASGGNLEVIGGSSTITVLINAIILLVAAGAGYKTIVKGIRGIAERKINAATASTVVVLACLIEDLVVGVASSSTSVSASLYTAAACFSMLMPTIARWLGLKRALANLEFITSGIQMYGTEVVESEEDTVVIGRGMQMNDSVICYNSKIKYPADFIKNSFADDPADYYAEKLTLGVLALAVIYAIVFGLIKHSAVIGLSGFAAVCCIAMPAFTLVVSNLALFMDDRKFSRKGAAIIGHRAVEESAYINTYAIDAKDLFNKGCSIIGIKTFHNMRIDDAILYAAALVIESRGALQEVFENVILGKNGLLPPVDTLAYEEHLGLSGWIHGRRVLFGNRSLLVNHNVELPDEDFEGQYTHNGRHVMYLAIAGKIAAMFVVKYRPDKLMRRCLRNMDRSGITVLISNTDCNITEELICKFYKIPQTAVKVLGPTSGSLLRKYCDEEKWSSSSGLLHNGTVSASMNTLYEARRLYDGVSINNIISVAFAGFGVLLAIILAATAGAGSVGLTDAKILIFQAAWSVLAVGIPFLRSRRVK